MQKNIYIFVPFLILLFLSSNRKRISFYCIKILKARIIWSTFLDNKIPQLENHTLTIQCRPKCVSSQVIVHTIVFYLIWIYFADYLKLQISSMKISLCSKNRPTFEIFEALARMLETKPIWENAHHVYELLYAHQQSLFCTFIKFQQKYVCPTYIPIQKFCVCILLISPKKLFKR